MHTLRFSNHLALFFTAVCQVVLFQIAGIACADPADDSATATIPATTSVIEDTARSDNTALPDNTARPSDAVTLSLAAVPESSKSGVPAFRVQSSNSPQYKPLILPEWYPLIRDGQIELEVYKRTLSPSSDDKEALELSKQNSERVSAEVDTLTELNQLNRGFPFGSVSGNDSLIAAKRMLWNIAARRLSMSYSRTDMQVDAIRDERLERQSTLSLEKLSGASIASGASPQLFRELLSFHTPDPLNGYKLLSFRFLGTEEDLVWLFSPLLGESRQLTGANRTDDLFRLGFSLDDISIWSGKVEIVVPQRIDRLMVFVPFFDAERSLLAGETNGCMRVSSQVQKAVVSIDQQTDLIMPEFDSGSGFSEGVIFVPRPVLRIELNPRDPFASHGRLVLYVDEELQMPFAKVVFDRGGQLWKLLWGALHVAESSDGNRREPFIREMRIREIPSKSRFSIRTNQIEWCNELPKAIARERFDPGHFSGVTPKPTAQVTPKR